jgi:hypothetical protein
MNTKPRLSPPHLGLAFGATLALFRAACVLTFITVPQEKALAFFNTLAHGIDFTPIIRHASATEDMLGIIAVFVLGWFAGALIALFYNFLAAIPTRSAG